MEVYIKVDEILVFSWATGKVTLIFPKHLRYAEGLGQLATSNSCIH